MDIITMTIVGIVVLFAGLLAGAALAELRWRLNSVSPEPINQVGKIFKVIELGSEWSVARYNDLDPEVELPEMERHRYCFIHRADMSEYADKNCDMCNLRHELEQARNHIAQQQEILDDLNTGGFVRSVFVPSELKTKILALDKDDAAEEYVRTIKAETLEDFADNFGCNTSFNALQEAQRIRDEKK